MKNITGLYKHQRDHVRGGGRRKATAAVFKSGELVPAGETLPPCAWCSYCDVTVTRGDLNGSNHKACGWTVRFYP